MKRRRSYSPIQPGSATFAGFRFPPDVISLAVRWYLRFGLSYRDLEELLAERGIEVDHVTLYRWVQRFTPLLVDAARPCRHAVGDRWFVDETYVKVAGVWRYVYRATDQNGQVIDVYVSKKRDTVAARRFFSTAISVHGEPVEVTTDKARTLAKAISELAPSARHDTTQYANNRVEADHGRLKEAPPDARPATRPDRQRDHPRPRVHTEPATRPLRARHRRRPWAPHRGGVRRAHTSGLRPDRDPDPGGAAPWLPTMQHRPTDRSPGALARRIVELLPGVHHDTTQYANNRVEADHGRLKARLRPMRGLKRDRTASVVIRGHAFMQNLRRGHYELGIDALPGLTVAAAFDELAPAI